MANTVQLTKNGQPVFPVTDVSLVMGLNYRPYDSQNPNGMGYLVLKKNKTFAEQVTEENTIYEIRNQFVLSSNFTMPTGCVLLFNGGEISGTGTLTFSETIILGNAKITCDVAGTIPGLVHAEWFGMVANDQTFDNSPIIQKVCRTFPFVEIDGDDYYCATPIDLSTNALKSLSVYANLHYVTTGSDTFLTFSGTLDARIYGWIIGPVLNNTGGSDRTIGIKFKDVNDSRIYVKRVHSFYTNIQVYSGADAIGNAYNNYEFGDLIGANILLELKADNPGWVTSNRFSIQRMTQLGGQTKVESAILIHADVPGFSDNIFEKLTIEGVRDSEPVKLINVNRVSFYNVRNEANNENFFYANYAIHIKTRFNYGYPTVRTEPGGQCHILNVDDHFAPYEPFKWAIHIPGGSNRHLLFNAIDSSKAQSINYSPMFYIPVGFIVPVTRREFIFTSKDPFDLSIVYYDASMNIITRDAQYMPSGIVTFKNSPTINNGYVTTSYSTLQSVAFPTLPEGCTYIGYFFRVSSSKTYTNMKSPIFSISTDLAANIDKSMLTYGPFVDHNKYGTTAQRPTFAEDYRQYLVGFEYFDTSIGKPIYAKSIASDGTATWVDATGAVV